MPSKKMPARLAGTEAPRTPTVLSNTKADKPTVNERKARRKARERRISVFKLQAHPLQPASRHAPENVVDLANSIRELGRMLEPPLVRRTIGGRYVILAGHRRCYAWRHLAAEGVVDQEIVVYVLEGISDQEEAKFVAAEYFHRKPYSVLHTARIVGAAHRAMCSRNGEEVPLRELEAALPLGRTSLGHYLTIDGALDDPTLGPLVHSVDKPSKLLLYKALSHDDFRARERALKAMQRKPQKTVAAARKAGSRGRPSQAVTRQKRGQGFLLTVKVGVRMTSEEVQWAREALMRALAEIEALHGPAEDAGSPGTSA